MVKLVNKSAKSGQEKSTKVGIQSYPASTAPSSSPLRNDDKTNAKLTTLASDSNQFQFKDVNTTGCKHPLDHPVRNICKKKKLNMNVTFDCCTDGNYRKAGVIVASTNAQAFRTLPKKYA